MGNCYRLQSCVNDYLYCHPDRLRDGTKKIFYSCAEHNVYWTTTAVYTGRQLIGTRLSMATTTDSHFET